MRQKRVAIVLLGLLAGCGDVSQDGSWLGMPNSRAEVPYREGYADLALGDLNRGDFPQAEQYAAKALYRNPKNPYGLYAAGLVYQVTGRPQKAQQMFQELLLTKADGLVGGMESGQFVSRPLTKLAVAHLKALDPHWTPPLNWQPPASSPVSAVPTDKPPTPEETNDAESIKRFQVLRALRDDGLMTDEEHRVRRDRNLGALLPLSAPPPATGLGRPGGLPPPPPRRGRRDRPA
ncbi:MAG: hypothetical protein FD149_1832 [Rhodospirillaceae bacterium]|nr:MAG: hypothetical protein FD149_1832 [Rhodospirillaceae bacterium]